MKIRPLFSGLVFALAVLLGGCQSFIQDLTPDMIQANPSRIYTFRLQVNPGQKNVIPETVKPRIVINTEVHAMERNPALGKNVWEFEYRIPAGVSELKYYYVVNYDYVLDGKKYHGEEYSSDKTPGNKIYTATVTNRYVVQPEADRGPVGAEIGMTGRGFTEFDKVTLDGQEVPTRFVSSRDLIFTVPAMPAGRTYEIGVRTGEGDLSAGRFRIDAASINVQPSSLNMSVGEAQRVTFFIDGPAPEGGIYIDVTTDVPSAVVMPEVTIPAGQRSVSVPVEAAEAASGSLWIKAPGFEEVRIPVSIQ